LTDVKIYIGLRIPRCQNQHSIELLSGVMYYLQSQYNPSNCMLVNDKDRILYK